MAIALPRPRHRGADPHHAACATVQPSRCVVTATVDYNKRYELRTAVATYFEQLEQRLLAAARVARQAAGRARYGR